MEAHLPPHCPHCQRADGTPQPLGVINTKISEDGRSRIRYIGCHECQYRPESNKIVIPIAMAPAQPTRSNGAKRARSLWRKRESRS